MQELLKKKEEHDKKAKKFELKKKKHEEEMKKMVEEEIEKKKAQRKALEESFWSRVRAKQKEKLIEKTPHKLEEPKRPTILLITNDRTSSVEPARTRDDTPDKSRMLKTHTFNTPQHSVENGKAITFSSFFKDDVIPLGSSPARILVKKTSSSKEPRQKSVEEIRAKKKEKEEYTSVSLPYIDGNKNGKILNEVISSYFEW